MGRKSSLKKKRSRDKKAMSSEEIIIPGDAQGAPLPDGQEEKILVSVRLRPLNEREISRNDVSDWECINNSTIIFKNSLPERSMFPAAYTFDRVFGSDSPTKQVYEEGAKEVILSVLGGINSSIFAYGQTSSGKTYTMSGITDYAVQDIYDYIDRHNERDFVLKFSAMEIYNEAVRDLLSTDPTPLRLLDDPERGTVVEKLTEEIVEDMNHLMELLSFCEAQRQIGETTLNENSSRSHQILRLTIESSSRQYLGAENSSTLAATVNFVDLAGSERASQTLSAGTRLKEGCHINRSLLTLGTVIRKLSKGRNAHIPFRDSKLTRILQNSLGGNAKTAIICTMSPARSHVEQSRNTLLFASCAKEVATNAQVNVVMSDKALVKQLQRELARLENEMKGISSTPDKSDSTELLKAKELRIAQMEKEIQELTRQRDLAQSKIENLLQSVGEDGASRQDNKNSAIESLYVPRPIHLVPGHGEYNAAKNFNSPRMFDSDPQYIQLSESAEDNFLLDDSTPKFNGHVPCPGWEEIAQKTDEESEDSCKEVRCIENEGANKDRKVKIDDLSSSPAEKDGMDLLMNRVIDEEVATFPEKEDKELIAFNNDQTCYALKQKIQELQKTVKYLLSLYPLERSPCHTEADVRFLKGSRMKRSMSCRAILMTTPMSLWLDKLDENEFTPTAISEKDFHGRAGGFYQKLSELKYNNAKAGKISRKDSEASISSSGSLESQNIKELDAEYGSNSHDFVAGSNETVKNMSQKQGASDLVHEKANETGESTNNVKDIGQDKMKDDTQANSNWSMDFERQRREIIELWNACNVPLIHRTYFFLLFKGDPSDSVYLEVELRRLSFLKAKSPSGKINIAKDSLNVSPASSLKELQREREMLSKQIHRKMPRKEREELYKKWGIALNTKQRSLQLAQRLWTDTKDMDHVNQSASLVAKLVGFVEPGQAPKEMFGLSFLPQTTSKRSYRWRHSLSSQL